MGYRKKIQFQGEEVWGEEIEFELERENWNSYILEDGTKLKLKTVLARVFRLEKYKEDGEPVYVINSTNLVAADVPDNLKLQQGR